MIAVDAANSGRRIAAMLAFAALSICSSPSFADNPIVQTNYTADPAPMVHDGRLYLYTSHDEDVTVNNFFTMNDWRLYSTVDMVNWTDHGSPRELQDLQLGARAMLGRPRRIEKRASSISTCRSTTRRARSDRRGVANSPPGPFTDPLGKPLVSTGSGEHRPEVFIDDDGQAYLYWGTRTSTT